MVQNDCSKWHLQNDLIDQILGLHACAKKLISRVIHCFRSGVADGVIVEDRCRYANNNPAFKVITFSEGNGFNVTLEQRLYQQP